ncbi:hypothetical protein A8C56_20015 [Niabella ginsenosidivorans]|uniref:Asparagine synthetase B n=1 Tax=Niabella ginsenosidivorans TaxID=1176587 RepID=A0A1A9I5M1_9BACT|nr:DUF2911 domain-containing protein [Niabella ginsenosidivorans]ANH82968.1 hypothetical protein A8C56_20015 [Niabella ginsenosidivorans]
MRKYLFVILIATAFNFSAKSQSWIPVDKSPMDQIYYPIDYPSKKIRGLNEPLRMRVIYSRPAKNNRKIFGSDIVPYGKVWRLGANEATEIDFFMPANINGKRIAEGRYTLYCIPTEKNWTFIINRDTDAWGAFNYDASKDVVRITVPAEDVKEPVESLTINFEKSGTNVNLVAEWDQKKASLPVNF